MKYNVKNAVSGIQGELDKVSRNKMLGQALGGLASGFGGAAKLEQGRKQEAALEAGLLGEQSMYDDMLKDPNASKLEKSLARMGKQRLGFLRAGLNPLNANEFMGSYKNVMGSGSLFDTLAGIERSKIMANRPLAPLFGYLPAGSSGSIYGNNNSGGDALDGYNMEQIKQYMDED